MSLSLRARLRQIQPAPTSPTKESAPDNIATNVVVFEPPLSAVRVGEIVDLDIGVSVLCTSVCGGAVGRSVGWVVPANDVGANDGEPLSTSTGVCVGTGVGAALAGVPVSTKTAAKSYPPAVSLAHVPNVDPTIKTWFCFPFDAKSAGRS